MTSGEAKPRDLGDIVGEAYRVYRTNFVRLIAIAAIAEAILLAIDFIMWPVVPSGTWEEWAAEEAGLFMAYLVIILLSSFVLYVLMQGALIRAITEQYIRQPVDIAQAYRFAWGRAGALLGAALLAAIAVGAMAITIIGIPLAVYFGVRWCFIPQAVILEAKSAMEAFSRSSDLVKNTWWRVFGILIVIGLIAGGVSMILSFTVGLIPWIGPSLVTILVAPIGAAGSTILYYDLVFRKEGYRVETMTR